MRKLGVLGLMATAALLSACGGGGEEEAQTSASATPEAPTNTAQQRAEGAVSGSPAGVTPPPAATDNATAADVSAAQSPAAASAAASGGSPTAAAGGAPAAGGGGVMLAGLTGDPARGQRVFGQCRTCHVVDPGVNRVGPSLAGIIGRQAGTVPNFRYSPANKNSGITWTEDRLFAYLENPRAYIPGTYMSFVGLRDPQQRADVIAYLKNPTT